MNFKKIMFGIIMLTFLTGLVIPTYDSGIEITSEYKVKQEFLASEEYNISSYLDFSKATGEIILTHLSNMSDGSIFRTADPIYEIIQLLPNLADYYWAIAGLTRLYEVSVKEGSPNTTLSEMISRAATRMVYLFKDPDDYGFGVDLYSPEELRTTKRAGVQAYAYEALTIAESINASLDFTAEKLSAINCITEYLYDDVNGGLYFFTTRNGSTTVPDYIYEVYPNDGARLDHLALGIKALFEAGEEFGNASYTSIALSALDFMLAHMKKEFQGEFYGFKLAVNRTGGELDIPSPQRSGEVVVSDLNAFAIRALVAGYKYTNDTSYLDIAKETIQALMTYNWDGDKGGFFAETLLGAPYDPLEDEDVKFYKYSEIELQMVIMLQEMYEITDIILYVEISIDTVELVLSYLWDKEYGGFLQNGNQAWECFSDDWKGHHTLIQGIAIMALERLWDYGLPIISNVRVNPVSPRPEDPILVSCTAQDSDGIDTVWVNYTSVLDDVVTEGTIKLEPNPDVGGVYNNTFGHLNDTERVNFYVYANDTLGTDFVVGVYFFLVRADTYEPILSLNNVYPAEPKAGDEIVLEFQTYEFPLHSAIVECALNWKVNSGEYTKVNLTWVAVDGNYLVWQVAIGTFGGGDVLAYYAEAIDESGNFGTSPFYRLTIIGATIYVTPLLTWQIVAFAGLVAVPPFGFAYIRARRHSANEQQRVLKKEARKRGRRARGKGRSRSRSRGGE